MTRVLSSAAAGFVEYSRVRWFAICCSNINNLALGEYLVSYGTVNARGKRDYYNFNTVQCKINVHHPSVDIYLIRPLARSLNPTKKETLQLCKKIITPISLHTGRLRTCIPFIIT